MGIYYSIFSRDNKEYIECMECGWKAYSMVRPGHCLGPLTIYLSITGKWAHSSVEVIGDYIELPWELQEGWTDITAQALEAYKQDIGIDLHA